MAWSIECDRRLTAAPPTWCSATPGGTPCARRPPLHAEWVRTLFFSDLDTRQDEQLADILATVYESILREGTLPRPDQT